MCKHILLVEDEQDLILALQYNFEREGYKVKSAQTGKDALALATSSPFPDLIILDLMLPDVSGLELCKKLKNLDNTKHIPIVMLTAKGEEIDRVVGFEIGADDYVVKPFSVRELLLRVKAVLRRKTSSTPPLEPTDIITFGHLKIDLQGHQIWIRQQKAKLTALEFRLLTTLLSRKGRVQTRDTLLNDVWGVQVEVTTRTVDTHIKRLREKLGSAGAYIETMRGVGYRFAVKPEEKTD